MVGRDGCFKALSYSLTLMGNSLLYSGLALAGKGPDMTA